MDKENVLRGVIICSELSSNSKKELLEYLEDLIEKANMYDGLCD